MPLALEVPVFSADAARTAVTHGAARLELNRAGSYAAGGLTPSLAEVAAVCGAVTAAAAAVPLRVMIRPRGALPSGRTPDFVYTADEFGAMRAAVEAFVASGLLQAQRGDGFVFGVLREEKNGETDGRLAIDVGRNRQLVAAAAPLACVFHRAMDLVLDPRPGDGEDAAAAASAAAAAAALRACGFAGVLTAGGTGPSGAAGHAPMLRRLAGVSDSLEIIVGGGVRSSHAAVLARAVLGTSSSSLPAATVSRVVFHASCLRTGEEEQTEVVDGDEVERLCTALAGWEAQGQTAATN